MRLNVTFIIILVCVLTKIRKYRAYQIWLCRWGLCSHRFYLLGGIFSVSSLSFQLFIIQINMEKRKDMEIFIWIAHIINEDWYKGYKWRLIKIRYDGKKVWNLIIHNLFKMFPANQIHAEQANFVRLSVNFYFIIKILESVMMELSGFVAPRLMDYTAIIFMYVKQFSMLFPFHI